MQSKRTCVSTFWCQSLLSMWLVACASAATATFRNQCNVEVIVNDHHSLCRLKAGTSSFPTAGCDRPINQSTVYFHGTNAQATLAEFSYGDSKVWYDISTVPPGATDCSSYDSCAKKTGKQGFNVGVMIDPVSPDTDATFACTSLLCQYANCPDASRFPADESKVRNCPEDQHFNVTFCP